MTGTVAVIGDVGGHLDRLTETLTELGADTERGALPDGLTVIQLGDLIHKGPDSDGVLTLVEKFRHNGAAWIQLAGNHEAHHLGGPRFWSVEVTAAGIDLLRDWDTTGFLHAAAAVTDSNGQHWLITHAGLVDGTWGDLGRPTDPTDAADALNDQWRTDRRSATRAGLMLGGPGRSSWPDDHVSVMWAEPTWELYEGWIGRPVPFHQIHGHASAYMWRERRWTSGNLDMLGRRGDAVADRKTHHTTVALDGGDIVGIDAQFGRVAQRKLRPHLLDGTVTAPT